MKEIRLAKTAGFCFGVRRAVHLAEAASRTYENCYTLGPIIHNESVVKYLEGLGVCETDSLEGLPEGSAVIIRSHGIDRETYAALERAGVHIIDATCPDVAKIHKIAADTERQGKTLVVMGQRDHAEVQAICGWCRDAVVFETPEALNNWLTVEENCKKDLAVVFQSTANQEIMVRSTEIIKKECTSFEIFDTICNATSKRQQEAVALARASDAMVVIGGRHSANSVRLFEICREHCQQVYFIETASELSGCHFDDADIVGIIAGASTPAWIIKEVYDNMSDEIKRTGEETDAVENTVSDEGADLTPEIQEEVAAVAETQPEAPAAVGTDESQAGEESFAEMLEKSIKTLHTGEKVTGIVAAITPTEISVDLGTKQAGYIPIAELTDDPDVNIEELVQVGGEVETYVMRVNDMEGTVMLSKKRLDTVKNWDDIEQAREEKRTVEGVVTEENKGGVVANVKGVRVFIPASQTGLSKGTPFSSLIRQRVKLRITEVNQSRRRVVGSIRIVRSDERKEIAQKTWDEIEVGKHYNGVVKSITSYGAFVDIGGVDGMVHVSELSWGRIKTPADVVSVGDEVDVYVLSFDKEKGKISLGYKDPNANPWKVFTDKYGIGDVAKVRVVKLMPFGAFAEIVPGVDGLIHISQIADRRIGRPDEFLTEGQEIDVKIVDIDFDKKNVSLSIRALIEPTEAPIQEQESAADDMGNVGDSVVYDTDVNAPTYEEEAPAEPAEETAKPAEETAEPAEETAENPAE